MRPIKLTLQAIGPFKQKVEIDFALIGNHELFLIHGKTGSGKTTLFDAICYALYGTVPSGREGCLKSDYAEETDKPYVEFEFELGTDRYRALRQLSHMRQKKNGEGLIGVPERLEFARVLLDGTTETLATKKKAMLEAVQEQLGLDVNQFSQVVLLPQGEFRKLLLANSSDRETLLEKLFDSSFYDGIQQWFEEEARTYAAANRTLHDKRQTYLDQALEYIDDERRPAEGAVFGVDTIDEEVGFLASRVKADKAVTKALSDAAVKKLQELEAARRLDKDIRDLDARLNAQKELEGQAGFFKELQFELGLAREAAALIPEMDEVARRTSQIGKFDADLKTATEVKAAAVKRNNEAKEDSGQVPELEKSARALAEIRDQLKMLRHTVETIGELYGKQEGFSEEIADAEEQRKTCSEQLEKLESTLKAGKGHREELKASEVDVESLRDRLKRLTDALSAGTVIKDQEAVLVGLSQKLEKAKATCSVADETLQALRERRERNLAGELAQVLEDGAACPVCGSPEHPTPAEVVDESATLDAIKNAETTLRRDEKAHQESRSAVEKANAALGIEKERLSDIEGQLDGVASGKEVERINGQIAAENERRKALDKIESEIQSLESDQLPNVKVQLATQNEKKKAATEAQKKLSKEIEKYERQFEEQCVPAIEERLTADEIGLDEVDALLGDIEIDAEENSEKTESIKTEMAEANEVLAGAVSSVEAAESVLKASREELDQIAAGLEGKVLGSSFESVDGVRKAARTPERIEESEQALLVYSEKVSSIKGVIKSLQDRIEGRERPDLEVLEGLYDEHKQKADEATETLHRLKHTRSALAGLATELRDLEKEFEDISAKMKVLGRIEEQVRGKGQPKISLKRYFLAHRLEEVLIQASSRLRVLSDGRFDLKRDTEVSDARSGAGLDLLVMDSFTGTERPVNSLSGGQMFLASLSMALGLADVVQARSGGVRLDTLLVDEGFGSLDDETLQTALKVLNELREGRMVGVISHVNELKRQIGNRIEVMSADAGSKVSMQVA